MKKIKGNKQNNNGLVIKQSRGPLFPPQTL